MNWNIFKRKVTLIDIFNKLGTKVSIRNGIGYGFISSPELYNNQHLEIGIGRIYSSMGDWGGGFDRQSASAIKIVIDKDFTIISITVSYYSNSISSDKAAASIKKIYGKLKKGERFEINDTVLEGIVKRIFNILPVRKHIGIDIDLSNKNEAVRRADIYINSTDFYRHIPLPTDKEDGKQNDLQQRSI